MSKQSLFSILSRQPWWMSMVIAIALFAGMRLLLPDILAAAMALPLLVVAAYAGWRQLRTPSAADVAAALDTLRAMSWQDFSPLLSEAFRRDGYTVSAGDGAATDFELTKDGHTTLVSCRRWKVARTGADPLRELDQARRARDAHACIYVSAGDFTANARTYAAEKSITLLNDAALARLAVRRAGGRRRRF